MWLFTLIVLSQDNHPMGDRTSSTLLNSELTPDEDSSGLDYMLALSLQSDGELLVGSGHDTQWSRMWSNNERICNMPSLSPQSPPNNNYPNSLMGPNALGEDLHQTGNCCNSFTCKPQNKTVVFYLNLFFSVQKQCCLVSFVKSCFQKRILFCIRFENKSSSLEHCCSLRTHLSCVSVLLLPVYLGHNFF